MLSQINVPHDYYFREMYLPQLTTGPGSFAWAPDGALLIYSAAGSLWRQEIGSTSAVQLTAGPGYDYQPDVSPDGNHVVYARYDGDAVELRILDMESGEERALTSNGAVNVDPRFSPDGEKIAFVSTQSTGRFHVRIGEFSDGPFASKRLVPERHSETPRYYYSEFDHQLSPTWTPDGEGLVLVANPEVPYGTGSIYLYPISGAEPTLVRREETSWKARPDVAPDGKRVAYASYLGRQWHQIWVTRIGGSAEPFPLTYGDFDATEPRWSPDGSRIAYISNESGNTAIRILEFVGGKDRELEVGQRVYLEPHGSLTLRVQDSDGQPTSDRISVSASDGRSYAPESAWMHGDDGFDRDQNEMEVHYFHLRGEATLELPVGPARVTLWHGPEHEILTRSVEIAAESGNELTLQTKRLPLPDDFDDWVSGDVHVHMNYGGTYRNKPEYLVEQARAEDLDVVFNLIVNKEQRVPDIAYFSPEPDAASSQDVLLVHAQEYHTSLWGHVGLLGLKSHLLLPDYVAYPETAAASAFPDNATVAELAREQGAIVGYVHPYLAPPPDPEEDKPLAHSFPVDAALGLVDYFEVVGFADHRASAEVWHRLMNCGVRVAAAGGTDAMANYASLRGPVGLNRTYVRMRETDDSAEARRDAWLSGLAEGHSMATNGPIVGLSVNGAGPGETLQFDEGQTELQYEGFLRSAVPVDKVEVLFNGRVVDTLSPQGDAGDPARADINGSVAVEESGWMLLRAYSEKANPLLFDLYAYSTTTPVWIDVAGAAPASAADAEYFLGWIERIRQAAKSHTDYNSDEERDRILQRLDAAQAHFEACKPAAD